MNIDIVKEKIDSLRGKNHSFKFNGSRNQIEKFDGIIITTYPAIFIIKTKDDNKLKAFSYNDVITSSLEVIDENVKWNKSC